MGRELEEHQAGFRKVGGVPERNVVVIEDDPNIADLVELYLRREGFRVLQAATGGRGLELVGEARPCLVVLDIGLPGGMDGLEVCRRLRASKGLPILVLTARDSETDRVVGLELGADDYMTKPFSPREMVARVRAILRRADGPAPGPIASVGGVEVDAHRRQVSAGGRPVTLATKEFDLLAYLVANAGMALSRRQILDAVWGRGWHGDERTVDTHVRQLRKKLGDCLPLATVWGIGYRLG